MWTPTPATSIVAAWIVASLFMAAAWRLQRRTLNAGIVDVVWTFEVGLLAAFFSIVGPGWLPRRAAIGAAMVLWSLRLGTYLLRDRVVGRTEDGRYATLRSQWGPSAPARFFWFFQAQALAALFFAAPPFLASQNERPQFHPLELMSMAIWIVGFAGEAIADRQLARFKAAPGNRGKTCQVGLWHVSRHPNYFFEWTMWLAYAGYALASPWGSVALLCPAVMLFLLFKVTGIPATEAQAIRSRGAEYLRYQQSTSVFVPWFRRA